MDARFDSVHNYNEDAIFRAVVAAAGNYPALSGQPDLLADVACVALNRLPPRYVRHDVDASFYMSDEAHAKFDAAVKAAVEHAFDFVQSRTFSRSA